MKLFFSGLALLLLSTPLLAQQYMDSEFRTFGHFEEGKTRYILKPLNDAIAIFDLEDNLIGKEENEIKQTGEKPYLVRKLSFFNGEEKVRERHELIHNKNLIRFSTFLNEDQEVIRQEQWKDGLLTYRSYTDPQTGETKMDQIILPSPNGGIKAWNTYISQNLRYPKEAMNRYTGIVHVNFEVDPSGNIDNIEVANPDEIHKSLAKEALRLISKYKGGWQPHQINGEAVTATLTFPIVFQMAF
jgi:TonB family protein